MTDKRKIAIISAALCIVLVSVIGAVTVQHFRLRDVKDDLGEYLERYFPDQRLIDFYTATDEEFSRFMYHAAVYHGSEYQISSENTITGDMIDSNMRALTRTNYARIRVLDEFMPGEWDEETHILIPDAHGQETELHHVIIYVEKTDDVYYTAEIAYIDISDGVSAVLADGTTVYAAEMFPNDLESDHMRLLEEEINKNPTMYERVRFSFGYDPNADEYARSCVNYMGIEPSIDR